MEETEVGLFSQTDLLGQMQAIMDLQRGKDTGRRTINTRHILFIVSGAFDRLGEQVKRRLSAAQIGFGAEKDRERSDADWLRLAQTRDFIDYGFEAEFIGRLPIRVVCDKLSADDLEQIMLHSEGSVLAQYRADFAGYGIEFEATKEALRLVAAAAERENTGARGLMTVLERVCRDLKFELPSLPVKSLTIEARTVEDPAGALEEIRRNSESAVKDILTGEVARFAERFEREQGLKLVFDAEATAALVALAVERNQSAAEVCRERFHDFEYGLKLAARNTGRTSFRIARKMVENPSEELSKLVARSFKAEK